MDGRVRKRYASDSHARTSFRRKGSDELTVYICHLAEVGDTYTFTANCGLRRRWDGPSGGLRELMGLFGLQTILKRHIAFYPPLMVLHIA